VRHPTIGADVQGGDTPLHLPWLAAFESVARHTSFARAAGELDVSPTAISKTIKQLEASLGLRLFNRTTRSVALTEAGAQLLDSTKPALEQIRHSVRQIGDQAKAAYGLLRINTSYVAYASLIEPHLTAFLERHPQIQLEISLDNALSDITGSGFDAGIRLGHALQRDMIGVPIGAPQRRVVVAAPRYLDGRTAPVRPTQLLEHDCIRQRIGRGRYFEWSFRSGRSNATIDVRGRLVFDEMRAVVGAARAGAGVAFVFQRFAREDIDRGALRVLLEKYTPPTEAFYLYYPHRAHMPGKLRAFIDFLQAANR
jgi:DNA-binding transcriptional LysR family regulator